MQTWQNCLSTILQRLEFNQASIQQKIESIESLVNDAVALSPYNTEGNEMILVPIYSSAYIISFLLILPKKGRLYDCAEDEKTGTGDHFEEYTLTEEEVQMIKEAKWPSLFKGGSARAMSSRPFHLIFD